MPMMSSAVGRATKQRWMLQVSGNVPQALTASQIVQQLLTSTVPSRRSIQASRGRRCERRVKNHPHLRVPSDKKPWMDTNGSASSENLSSGFVHHSSWMRRSSSGSSCDESSSPPPRVMFNPFPKRALQSSENRTRTRMKLGLFPAHIKGMRKEPLM